MKKLLGSTLALAMLVPAGANAELLKNFKMGGSLEVDAVSANNVKDFSTATDDTLSTIQTRLMVHADWDVLDDVHAHISMDKNDRTWGGTAGGSGAVGGSQNLQTVQGAIAVDESYVKIDKLFGGLDTTLGRQYYGEQGDVVIYFGPKYNLYGMPITALDGARFDWSGEKVSVTALASKIVSGAGALGGVNTNDQNLIGVDVHVKATDKVTGSAYLYNRTIVNSGTNGVVGDDELFVAGLKGKVTMGGGWLKAEFDKDFGANRVVGFDGNYTGWAGKLDGGYKADVGSMGALTGWGQYALGSGGSTTNRNFTAIAGDYRPGGIYGRFLASGQNGASTFGQASTLSDLQVIGVGVKANPAALSKLTAGVSWYDYHYESVAGMRAYAVTLPGVPANFTGSNQIGNELDIDLTWQNSENVSVSAGYGTFQADGFIKDVKQANRVGNNPATLLYADASIKF